MIIITFFQVELKDKLLFFTAKVITSLETQISANLEAQNRLGTLFSKGYIEPALFTKESADLAAEAELLQSEKVNLSNCLNNNATYISEAKKLQAALSGLEMLDRFDGDLFTEYVDHITVIAADQIRFSLKCGLELEEEIGK